MSQRGFQDPSHVPRCFSRERDDPRIMQEPVLKMFYYFNNHPIVIPICSLCRIRIFV